MSELPPRELLLDLRDPAALFGAAVDDPRALRRAYAALIKVFDAESDPEAFAHVRRLYEEARQGSGPLGPSDRMPSATERSEPTRGTSPADALEAVLRAGRVEEAAEIFTGHLEEIAASAPWQATKAALWLVHEGGPRLDPGTIDALELLAARPDLPLHPDEAEALELDVLRVRAIRRAMDDPDAARPLIDALVRAWRRPLEVAAWSWVDAAARLAENEVDPAVALAHIERDHATVASLWTQTELAMLRAAREGSAPDVSEDETAELQARFPPSSDLSELHRGDTTWWFSWPWQTGVYLAFLLPIVMFKVPVILGVLVAIVLRRAQNKAFERVLHEHLLPRRFRAFHSGSTDPLLALCRDRGIFPRELAVAGSPPQPVPIDDRFYAYMPGHPLLELARDPAALLQVVGPRHVARVRRGVRRLAEAQARAEAEGAGEVGLG